MLLHFSCMVDDWFSQSPRCRDRGELCALSNPRMIPTESRKWGSPGEKSSQCYSENDKIFGPVEMENVFRNIHASAIQRLGKLYLLVYHVKAVISGGVGGKS